MWVLDRKKGKERGNGCQIGTAQSWILAKKNMHRANMWTHVLFFFQSSDNFTPFLLCPLSIYYCLSRMNVWDTRKQLPHNLSRKLRSFHIFFNKCGLKLARLALYKINFGSYVSESWLYNLQVAAQSTWDPKKATHFCMTVAHTCIWASLDTHVTRFTLARCLRFHEGSTKSSIYSKEDTSDTA